MAPRYRFRLDGVLRLRRAEYEKAALALERANTALRSLISDRDAAAQHCREIAGGLGGFSFAEFLEERERAARGAAALSAAESRVNVAAAEAALARIAWSTAHRNVAALERLDDRRREEWMLEAARREHLELDELATVAFVREHAAQAAS